MLVQRTNIHRTRNGTSEAIEPLTKKPRQITDVVKGNEMRRISSWFSRVPQSRSADENIDARTTASTTARPAGQPPPIHAGAQGTGGSLAFFHKFYRGIRESQPAGQRSNSVYRRENLPNLLFGAYRGLSKCTEAKIDEVLNTVERPKEKKKELVELTTSSGLLRSASTALKGLAELNRIPNLPKSILALTTRADTLRNQKIGEPGGNREEPIPFRLLGDFATFSTREQGNFAEGFTRGELDSLRAVLEKVPRLAQSVFKELIDLELKKRDTLKDMLRPTFRLVPKLPAQGDLLKQWSVPQLEDAKRRLERPRASAFMRSSDLARVREALESTGAAAGLDGDATADQAGNTQADRTLRELREGRVKISWPKLGGGPKIPPLPPKGERDPLEGMPRADLHVLLARLGQASQSMSAPPSMRDIERVKRALASSQP